MAATRPLTTHEMLVALSAMEPTAFYWSTDTELAVQHISGGAVSLLQPELSCELTDDLRELLLRLPLGPASSLLAAHRRALEGECSSCDFAWMGWRFRGHIVPHYDDGGSVTGCLGLAHQVADCEALESALDASEGRFEALVQLAPVGIYLTDAEGNCRYVNRRWREMAGLTSAEALGRGWLSGIHPDDRELIARRWYDTVAGHKQWELEYRMQTPDGTTTWVLGQAAALCESDGQLSGFLGISVDITQRKLAASRLRLLLDSAPDAMVIVDRSGRIILANERAERLFGFTKAELVNQPVELLVPERFRERHIDHRSKFSVLPEEGLLVDRRELTGRRKDGSEFPAEISLNPIEADEEVLFSTVVRDITTRKAAEAALSVNLQVQSTLTALLALALEPLNLREKMERTLDILLSVPWIELQSKGAIFIVSEGARELVMIAQRGMPDMLVQSCGTVPFDECRCGRAAASGHIVFGACDGEEDETRDAGMPPQGQYCVPILSTGEVMGVVNLYVASQHRNTENDQRFLQAVANVMAGMIASSRAEDSLRASEERFELAVRGSDAGIWDWNLIANQVYYSPRWKSMLGYGRDEIQDDFSAWESRLHPDDRERALATIGNYLEGRTGEYELEHRLRHRDGTYRWILARGAVVRDSRGKPYRMVGSHLDITDRKQFERQLRQREAQLIAAQRIQEFFLPRHAPKVAGFDIAGKVIPAEFAGGDYFDYLSLPDGSLGIVVGDVSGHDVSASLVMAATSAHLRSFAEDHTDVEEILVRTNSILSRETDDARFVTLIFLRLDASARSLSYVNAGHPSAYIIGHSGQTRHVLHSMSFPLSVVPDATYPLSDAIELESGDVVLLVTDGILESRSPEGETLGTNRLLDLVHENRDKSAEQIVQSIADAIGDFTHRERARDDLTAVVVKVLDAEAS